MTLPNLKPIIYKLFFSQTPKLPRYTDKEQISIHDVRLVKEYYGKHDKGCCEAAFVVSQHLLAITHCKR